MNEDTNTQQPISPPTATPPSAADTAAMEAVPTQWPGAFGAYKYSKAAVMVNIWTLVGIMVASFVASIIFANIAKPTPHEPTDPAYFVLQLLQFGLSMWLSLAIVLTGISSVKRQKLDVTEALRAALPLLPPFIGLMLLTSILLFVSFLLLIVPFFFVLPRLVLAPYYLVDQKLGVIDAIQASWINTKGHAGKVWGTIGLSFLMALLMLTIIGMPIAIYLLIMYSFVDLILYYFIKQQTIPAVQPAPGSTTGATPPTTV